MKQIFEKELGGRTLHVEVGQLAQLASGSVLLRYGDTVVLSVASASAEPQEGVDFFPLTVEYEEKMYAAGKFPGGFKKREGRPTDHATVTARSIDRGMRPLFPKELRNDVVLTNTVLAVDHVNSPEFLATFGSSLAVAISSIPFNGPMANIDLSLIDGEVIVNPTIPQSKESDLALSLAGTKDRINMIEAGANEVDDAKMLEAIAKGQEVINDLCDFISEIVDAVGVEKFDYEKTHIPGDLQEQAIDLLAKDVRRDIVGTDKAARDERLAVLKDKLDEFIEENYPTGEEAEVDYLDYSAEVFDNVQKYVVRKMLKEEHKRVDGRDIDEIRPLSAEIDVLPQVHGSALFQRGETQVLNIVTLGSMANTQTIDDLSDEEYKRYMHQYNFPQFSVGEARPSRSPSRREIGHGNLAEKALMPVLPSEEEFPYAIRSVSEVLMSNGSTSQASVCSSSMALMAAGVPTKRHVAGISAGLITGDSIDDYEIVMDIQGIEDFYGDMDFKVAGTTEGITAIQVDIKVDGLTLDIIRDAFAMTKKGRLQIINDVLTPTISAPRENLAATAPKIVSTSIPEDKIGEVIGKGGKTINTISEETDTTLEIDDDGTVFISGLDQDNLDKAKLLVEGIATDPEVGDVYEGKVTRIENYGVFVEYLPGKEGLCHISKMSWDHVDKPSDLVDLGDIVKVKIINIDDRGRIDLSMRKDEDKPESFNKHNKSNRRNKHHNDRTKARPRKPGQRRHNNN